MSIFSSDFKFQFYLDAFIKKKQAHCNYIFIYTLV